MIEFQIINKLSILALKNRHLLKKLWENIRTSLRYVLICDGMYTSDLCTFAVIDTTISIEKNVFHHHKLSQGKTSSWKYCNKK